MDRAVLNLDTQCFRAALDEYRMANPDDKREPAELPARALSPILARAQELKVGGQLPRFVAVGRAIMYGNECVAISKRGHSMAKRIANALNNHKTTREGV